MTIRKKTMLKRFLALFISLLMLLTPVSSVPLVFAASIPEFAVQLSEKVAGATVKIADETDAANVYTANTDENGIANFTVPLDDAKTYTIDVTGMVGYEDFQAKTVNISGMTSFNATIVKMPTVKVTGTVYDENGVAFNGANLALTGYSTGSAVSDESGKFSIEVYKGQQYTLTVTAADRYNTITKPLNNTESDLDLGDIKLELRTFTISTSAGTGGTITDSAIVSFGSDKVITVNADSGYEIASLTIDGNPISDARSKGSYTYTFAKISKDAVISADFKKAYTITVTYDENGKVQDEAGKDIIGSIGTLGGSVVILEGDNATFKVIPKAHYYVSSITVDSNILDLANDHNLSKNRGTYTYIFTSVTGPHTFTASFANDTPKVDEIDKSSSTWTNQSVTISGTAIDTGESGLEQIRYSNSLEDYNNDSYEASGSSVKTATVSNGKFSFVVDNSQNHEETYYVWAYDYAGNKSEYKTENVQIESAKPTVDDISSSANEQWTKDAVRINGKVSDLGGSNIYQVRYSNSESEYKNDTYSNSTAKVTDLKDGQYSFDLSKESNETYYVWAFDNAGNKSDAKTVKVQIDKTNPTVSEFKIFTKNDSLPAKLINLLTFGNFFKEAVVVTVTASDQGISSGLKEIKLLNGNAEIAPQRFENNKASFDLSVIPSDQTLSAIAEDNVGNSSHPTSPTEISGRIILEQTPPTAQVTTGQTAKFVDLSGRQWYTGDVPFNITAEDKDSGLRSVEVTINDGPINEDKNGVTINDDFYLDPVYDKNFVVNTDQIENADGPYKIEAKVTDNAGNVSSDYKTIYKDTKAPEILKFDFAPEKYKEGDGSPVVSTDYGYYFREKTDVTITARDSGSGVKSITYYTLNKEDGVKSEEQTDYVNNNQITVQVPAGFKGQIYAKATDNVDNTKLVSEFVTPNGTIIEDDAKHKETSSIALDVPKASSKDNTGLDLYSTDVDIKATVSDTFSGIRTIEWSVESPNDTDKNQSGTINVDNSGKLSGENIEGWTADDNVVDNLVTEMTKTISVKNNSNDIVVRLKLTDRGGNTSDKELKFSIDKTAPTIEVSYDNNSFEKGFSGETHFFKANRIAKVVIKERNFNKDDVNIAITNSDGTIPTVNGWTESKAKVPDETTYTATIEYTADGDYAFNASFVDLAGNKAEDRADKFTIDKKAPVISVVYDNNKATNQNYYSAGRTAIITINEHNFETSRISIKGTATDNGAAISYPATSSWTTNGDVHTATIRYAADGLYTLNIAYTDKAGNAAADFAEQTFYVDKTAPTLVISGVADKSANKGDVIPVVTFSDTNFDKNTVTLTLNGANRGEVGIDGSFADITNGQKYTFKNFEKVQDVDDIYTLTAKLVDKAGNQTEEKIMFSVNRFGSVYAFASDLKSIQGKYVKNEIDAVITETNVDKLNTGSVKVKVTKNGVPADLVEGADYTVVNTGGDGQWSQYQYTINKSVFKGDGKYMITLSSTDAAGNVNENIDESKKAEMWFGVDKTAPVVVPINLEPGKTYPEQSRKVTAAISDNLVLNGVKIYLNDVEVKPTVSGENYSFDIASSNSSQKVKIVALDAAGNESTKEITRFYVTTNLFVRWFTNTPLFVGTLLIIVLLGTGVTFVTRRKKIGLSA